jgi:hypothetical protein
MAGFQVTLYGRFSGDRRGRWTNRRRANLWPVGNTLNRSKSHPRFSTLFVTVLREEVSPTLLKGTSKAKSIGGV